MKKKYLVWAVIVLLVVLVALALAHVIKKRNEYSIVYLTTGEVYVGKLRTFPDLELTDSYVLQVVQSAPGAAATNNFQLTPVKEALWAPKRLHLVEKNVVFYGPLSPESQIGKALTTQATQPQAQ